MKAGLLQTTTHSVTSGNSVTGLSRGCHGHSRGEVRSLGHVFQVTATLLSSDFCCWCLPHTSYLPPAQQVQGKGAPSKNEVQYLRPGQPEDCAQFHFYVELLRNC